MIINNLLIGFCVLLLASCGKGPDIAGSGSESPNALTGTVFGHQTGLGPSSETIMAKYASVYLYEITPSSLPSDGINYVWSLQDSLVCDSAGHFKFDSLKGGDYSFIVALGTEKAFSGYFHYNAETGIKDFGNITLQPTQNILGTVRDTTDSATGRFILSLVGTPYKDTTSLQGAFAFNSVPIGSYNFKIEKDTLSGPLPVLVGDLASNSLIVDTTEFNIGIYQIKYTQTKSK